MNTFDLLFDAIAGGTPKESYPKYDILASDENNWLIDIAVAGFAKEDIDIRVEDDIIVVKAQKTVKSDHESSGGRYVHRGIAHRSFEKRFKLGEYAKVDSATYSHGILRIAIVKEVPEAKKPKQIPVM